MSTKLELNWVGKRSSTKLEPRVLVEDPEKSLSYRSKSPETDVYGNYLIKGDNLLALKALSSDFSGQVKCVIIDPPYNTGSAFSHYEDGLEHSLWLTMFRDRLEQIHNLLSEDGSVWIMLDDNEVHYARVVSDEIFGRNNFISNVVWEKKYSPQNNATWLSDSHDHILVFAKSKQKWRPNKLPRSDEMDARYRNLDQDPRGPWKAVDFTISLTGGQRGAQFARTGTSPNIYEIVTPSGRTVSPARGRCWAVSEEKFKELVAGNRIWFGEHGNNIPAQKRFISEVQDGVVAKTLWFRSEVGDNQEAKREAVAVNSEDVFSTPKPERLIQRILQLASEPGDWILDSFAGSGTTGAVAQKMRRRWIMVELGDHCDSHILPRMRSIVSGTDRIGITDEVDWTGGGGFQYFNLAPSLLEKDRYGNWIISSDYKPEMLAEALCKHMGFTYAPSQNPDEYWNHGYSTETDFIYVTTQNLTHQALSRIAEDVGPDRSLLICCKAFNANADAFENLTIKKIPHAVLRKCEWGKDDYSLNVANLPMASETEEEHQSVPTDDLPLFADNSTEGEQ